MTKPRALFIGHSYIDVTFLTDHIPTGDEKYVAQNYACLLYTSDAADE